MRKQTLQFPGVETDALQLCEPSLQPQIFVSVWVSLIVIIKMKLPFGQNLGPTPTTTPSVDHHF